MCPLKEAARDAPHHLAILAKDFSLTYAELDRYVDEFELQESSKLNTIAQIFSAWRKNESLFIPNPRIPPLESAPQGPPSSLLLRTSGSTGKPKIAILSFESLLINAAGVATALELKPGDQWLLSLPLYHVGGIGIVFRCIAARATLVLDDCPSVTHLSYVPTHLYRATPVYKNLRCLLLGGAPISSYPSHLPIHVAYGLTEMGSTVTLDGQILSDRELQIAPDGEILVRGPCLFQGYLGEPPPRNWFPTGDLGFFEKGLLQIKGRKDWMFISGGENIQPEEIEHHLLAMPEVLEAIVLPKDDPEFGQRPIAVIRASQHLDFSKMQTFLRDRLPKFKIPIELHFVEEIPKKNEFKPDRFILSQIIKDQSYKNKSGQKK